MSLPRKHGQVGLLYSQIIVSFEVAHPSNCNCGKRLRTIQITEGMLAFHALLVLMGLVNRWLRDVVVDLKLCPWASPALQAQAIQVSQATRKVIFVAQ